MPFNHNHHDSPNKPAAFSPKLFAPIDDLCDASNFEAGNLEASTEIDSTLFVAEDETELDLPPELTALAEQLIDDASHLSSRYAATPPSLLAALDEAIAHDLSEPAQASATAVTPARRAAFSGLSTLATAGTTAALLLTLALATIGPSAPAKQSARPTTASVDTKLPASPLASMATRNVDHSQVSLLPITATGEGSSQPLKPWWELSTPELEAWLDLAEDSGEVASISF